MSKSEIRNQKIPGKLRVLGYSRVIKGTGAGVQIRKNIRRLIADHTDWELIQISTDYCETENQEETCKNFLRILTMVKLGYIDVFIIYAGNDIESILPAASAMYLYIAYNGQLLSSESDEKLIVSR